MASLHERLAEARRVLTAAGMPDAEAALDAELLARHVLQCDRATLLMRARDPLPSAFDRHYASALARRAAREPVAYILGRQEFWGLEFDVTPDVLIPRPETELIVEEAIGFARGHRVAHLIDVGTGSGCLAVALAIELPPARVTATDLSAGALAVATRNAARHGVQDRVSLVRADLLEGIGVKANLIVANPPYVPAADAPSLQPEVGQYEPASALLGGADGLDVMRRLFATAPVHLADGGCLVVEFGFGQEARVRSLATAMDWHVTRVRNDLQGIPRVAVLRR